MISMVKWLLYSLLASSVVLRMTLKRFWFMTLIALLFNAKETLLFLQNVGKQNLCCRQYLSHRFPWNEQTKGRSSDSLHDFLVLLSPCLIFCLDKSQEQVIYDSPSLLLVQKKEKEAHCLTIISPLHHLLFDNKWFLRLQRDVGFKKQNDVNHYLVLFQLFFQWKKRERSFTRFRSVLTVLYFWGENRLRSAWLSYIRQLRQNKERYSTASKITMMITTWSAQWWSLMIIVSWRSPVQDILL